MSYSEIFDNYEKIAIENGLVSEAQDSAALKRYKKSPNPRVGSDSIDKIEELYDVKPEQTVKYDTNIIDAAHPNPVVIGPSYDRLNGLIENENERNSIMVNIVNKPVNGNITLHRYAKNELLMALVRIANDADNRGMDEIRKLADSCIEILSNDNEKKKSDLKKSALAFLPVVGIMAAVAAAMWAWQHLDDPDRGLLNNIMNAKSKLKDLEKNSWYESDVDETVKRDVDSLISKLDILERETAGYKEIMDEIRKPSNFGNLSSKDLISLKDTASTNGTFIQDRLNSFVSTIDGIVPELVVDIDNFSDSDYQKEHTSPSAISRLTGWVGEALHGRWGLIANDFISAVNALNPLLASLQKARAVANNIDSVRQKLAQDINAKVSKVKEQSAPGAIAAPQKTTPSFTNPLQNPDIEQFEDDVGNDYAEAAKMFGEKI
jgi:hypothetical protein